MQTKKRIIEIDILRGLAILVMIFLHTSVYFLTTSLIKGFWNYGHFAVPVFIFCSAYLFFDKSKAFNFPYLLKRFWRLLYPYYIFALFYFFAVYLREPGKLNLKYILNSTFVIGGIDISWLVLLFLQLTFVMPFVLFLWKKKKAGFWVYVFISILSSVLLTLLKWPYDYRFIMWLQYSIVIIYTMFFVFYKDKKWFLATSFILPGLIFIILRIVESGIGHSLNLFDNKYPPNLYYIAFGIFSTAVLFSLAKKGIFSFFPVKDIFLFLSKYSYSIFFIHYLLLYIFVGLMGVFQFNLLIFFLSIFFLSLTLQLILNKLKSIVAIH